jgi:hypothetical protein
MRSQNTGNAISETQILKISWGACRPPDRPCYLVPAVLGSHLRRSHTILGEGQGKWALWQFCPTTEESLKNALTYFELMDYCTKFQTICFSLSPLTIQANLPFFSKILQQYAN